MYIQWANWYFTPVYFAMAMVFVVLNRMCRKHQAEAWILMFFATIYAVVVHPERLPADFPTHAFSGVAGCLVHPLYASGAYLFRMFFLSRLLSRDVWLVGIGLAGPVLHGAPSLAGPSGKCTTERISPYCSAPLSC